MAHPKRFAAGALTIAAIVAGIVAAALPRAAIPASPEATLGVFGSSGSPTEVGAFGRWLGRRPVYALNFLPKGTWTQIARPPGSGLERWRRSGYRMVYSVAMIPDEGGSLAEGARGAYDDIFRRLARTLAAHGQGGSIVRLGWEMNGDWFKWSIAGGSNEFAAYWRRIVTAMRAVAPRLRFDFAVNDGSSVVDGRLLNPAAAYPGDRYVDYIGLDVYDQGWRPGSDDPAVRWAELRDQPYGLAWQSRFARAHHKQMSYPEWALADRRDGHGGGDAPAFIERMHAWIASHPVAYAMYFDANTSVGDHAISGGAFPQAACRYRQLFGAAGATC